MSEAPERIWAKTHGAGTSLPSGERYLLGGWQDREQDGATEYLRADIARRVKPALFMDIFGDGSKWEAWGVEYPIVRTSDGTWFYKYEKYEDFEEAKPAAQADFEERILGELE